MTGSIGDREPVRLPLWIAGVGSAAIALLIDLLSSVEWRSATIGFLLAVGPVLFGTELARQRAWSPSSVWLATVQARRDSAGADEREPVTNWGDAGRVDLLTLGVFLLLVAVAAAVLRSGGFI